MSRSSAAARPTSGSRAQFNGGSEGRGHVDAAPPFVHGGVPRSLVIAGAAVVTPRSTTFVPAAGDSEFTRRMPQGRQERRSGANATHPAARSLEPAGDLFSDDEGEECCSGHWSPAVDAAAACDIVVPRPTVSQMSDKLMVRRQLTTPSIQTTASTSGSDFSDEAPTTVMLQRIPFGLDEEDIGRILDERGLAGTYDVVYMPRNRKKRTNLGYSFVNFVHTQHAAACIQVCHDRPFGAKGLVQRVCSAEFAKEQGGAFLAERAAATLQRECDVGRSGNRALLQAASTA